MIRFGISGPGRILFGRGEADRAPGLIRAFGVRVLLVHGARTTPAAALSAGLDAVGCTVQALTCATEPTLPMLQEALHRSRSLAPAVVVGLGGGAVLDLAKALAALIPAPGGPLDHLEVVGRGLPLTAAPLPFVAIPTTAGTGAEATRNAVIGVPEERRKVSLRDDRMTARLAIVDPALTDRCPRGVTLASGLDALTQVIEPFVSLRATPFTDALSGPAIPLGLAALMRLMQDEAAPARDDLAWVSLCGGLALSNGGLGAVHGLAGVIGGVTGAAHGAICGALLGPVLAMNRRRASGAALARLDQVCAMLATGLGSTAEAAPGALQHWAFGAGLPGLAAQGLQARDHPAVVQAARSASSMQANPVVASDGDLLAVLAEAG